jgi:Zn-finger nucleic acid-binding protein
MSRRSKKRLLLIKPRWLPDEAVKTQLQALREEYSNPHLTLLAEAALPQEIPGQDHVEFIELPSTRDGKLKTLRRLRRRRFDEAVVLVEAHRGEVGFLEAKFWAFVAKARRRRLGNLRQLSLSREFADKWRRFTPLIAWRAFLTVRAAVSLPSRLEARSRGTLRYLQLQRRRAIHPISVCPVCEINIPANTGDLGIYHRQCPTCGSIYFIDPSLQKLVSITATSGRKSWKLLETQERSPSFQQRRRKLETFVYLRQHDRLCGKKRGNYLSVSPTPTFDLELARRE